MISNIDICNSPNIRMKEGVERLERLERFEQFFSLYYSGSANVGSIPPRTQSWPFSILYLY